MARYKTYSYEQTTMIPICFDKQLRPGTTFEYALNYIVDNAELKPKVRNLLILNGFKVPEICTPQELLGGF